MSMEGRGQTISRVDCIVAAIRGALRALSRNLAVLALSQMSGEQFLAWGWRVPFFLSIVLVGMGLYIRLGIFETPVFAKLLAERRVERTPVLEVIMRQPKEIILSAFVRMAEQAPFYIFTAFIFSYGTGTLRYRADFLLTAVLAHRSCHSSHSHFSGISSDPHPPQEHVHDRAAVTGVFGFIYFGLLNTGSATIIFLAIFLSLVPHDMMYGPQAALIAESFTGRFRYSGPPPATNSHSITAGGPAPLIATWLFGADGTPLRQAGLYSRLCGAKTHRSTAR